MKARRRVEAPPPGQPVPVQLVSCPTEGQLTLRWLGAVRGLLSHWGREGGIACPGEEECPTAVHRSRTVWKGYVPVEVWRPAPYEDWAPAVFEVTERLYELLDGHQLRGMMWRIARAVSKNNMKEVIGEPVGECNADFLRPAFPVEPVLFRVYRTTRIQLDVEPILPPRLILPPAAGPAPYQGTQAARPAATSGTSFLDDLVQKLRGGSLSRELRERYPKAVAQAQAIIDAEAINERQTRAPGRPEPSGPTVPQPSTNGRHSTR